MAVDERASSEISTFDPRVRIKLRGPEDLSRIPGLDEMADEFVALKWRYRRELDRQFSSEGQPTPDVDRVKEKYEPRLTALFQMMLELSDRFAEVDVDDGE